MRKRGILGSVFLSLLMGLGFLVGTLPSISGEPSIIMVPDHYSTIQEAIDNANEGDTIFVRNGLYVESIVIDRTVSLEGESQEGTVIQRPDAKPDIIIITADNVTIHGFTIRGVHAINNWQGIWIRSSNCLIENNIVEHAHGGIFLDGRADNVTSNAVINNCIRNNVDTGILVWSATDNQIKLNNITGNSFGVYLFSFGPDATRNLVEGNHIANSQEAGIVLDWHCSNNVVKSNNVSGNGWSGHIFMSGIALEVQSETNQIVFNNINNNKRGVYQRYFSSSNSMHHNSFINNAVQVHHQDDDMFPSANIWDIGYPSGGNYWSDYSGADFHRGPFQNETGSDGIGDTPYIIDADNIDHYPLMNPYSPLIGDLNEDLTVDIRDIAIICLCFGATPDHIRWDLKTDINHDHRIDIKDLIVVAANFGTKWTP